MLIPSITRSRAFLSSSTPPSTDSSASRLWGGTLGKEFSRIAIVFPHYLDLSPWVLARAGQTAGGRCPCRRPQRSGRLSPCTLVFDSFSNGFPHAKAPTHAEGQNLVCERASYCFGLAHCFWMHGLAPPILRAALLS